MPRRTTSAAERPRVTLEVAPAVHRRLRLAAAKRDQSIREYVLAAVEERLQEDLGEEGGAVALTARTDPVLVALCDNRADAAYDRL